MILGGDLNLTTSIREVWGENLKSDPLDVYFFPFFDSLNLMDKCPSKLSPMWRNMCNVESPISKRLEKFFLFKSFFSNGFLIKSWVKSGGLSNHCLIVICLEMQENLMSPQFKFNASWLKELDFIKVVEDS